MKTLDNKKVFVSTPETSKAVQEKAFKLGFQCIDTLPRNTLLPFIFFYKTKTLAWGVDFVSFRNHDFEEITAAEILAMEVLEPEETFEVFQKVLVRDEDNEEWIPSFYRNKEVNVHWVISGAYFNQCIDYKKNKHLAFTTDKP